MQDFLFAFEVKINRAVRNAGLARDIGNFGIEITIARENADCSTQDRAALVGDYRSI